MINIHNISNLEIFDQKGYFLSCSNDLKEAIQIGITEKVGKLLNTPGVLSLIPNFDPNKDTKLRIHLTKDGITIQLLERALDASYTKKDLELSEEVKTRKEKIIKKVDFLFQELCSLDSSSRLKSKVPPLFIPLQSIKEQVPSKIGFNATLSNPQIQQLHAKIEDPQDQLNTKTSYAKDLQLIKEQFAFLNQAIHKLSLKEENITYPHTEEYALINKLVDNQQDIYRALLDLLSKNLNQLPSVFQDFEIKKMTFESKENAFLEGIKNLSLQVQKELVDIKEGLKDLSHLKQTRKDLESINTILQKDFSSKNEQIIALKQQIQNLPEPAALQKLQAQLEMLQNEKTDLQINLSIKDEQISKLNKEIQYLFEAYQVLKNQLENESEYYTLNTAVSQEESLKKSSKTTILQAEINDLREELNSIRPIVYNLISKIEKSNKALALELSEKTKIIEGLEEEKIFLEAQLDRSESRLKDLQRVQHTFNEQQKEISISLEENIALLEELEKTQVLLSLEKRKRAQLEQAHEDQLEKLKTLYKELTLEKMSRININIRKLQQEQKNICFTLTKALAEYVNSESITKGIGKNIVDLIEKALDTTGYKTLLDLVSKEEDFTSSEENVNLDEYDEDSYIGL